MLQLDYHFNFRLYLPVFPFNYYQEFKWNQLILKTLPKLYLLEASCNQCFCPNMGYLLELAV